MVKPLLVISFLFLFTFTSARESIIPNVAHKMQPSQKPKNDGADKSTNTHSTYPPGFENTPPSHLPSSYPPSHSPLSSPSGSGSGSGSESLEINSIFSEPSSTASGINSVTSSDQADSSSSSSSSGSSSTPKDDKGGAAKPEGSAAKTNKTTNIKTICDKTDYPDLCIATIAPFMKGRNNNVDPKEVLEVAMRATDQFAKLGFAVARRASESPATPPNTKKMLKTCLDSWDTVLYNYQQAIEALRTHDSGRMSTMLSAAITDVSDCEDAVEGFVSPMVEYGEKMVKLTSICLAIVSSIAV